LTHLPNISRWMEIIGIIEMPAEFLREQPAGYSFSGTRDATNDHDHDEILFISVLAANATL
jgi:hypothetical protein